MATESAVLALFGGAAGIAVAKAAVPLLAALVPDTLPIAQRPSLDLRVLGLAALLTAVTGFGFGVFPAWRAAGARGLLALRDGARTARRGQRTRRILVTVQVTASVFLVAVSGLLVRALWRIEQVDPGFRAEHVLTLRTALPSPAYDLPAKRQAFYQRVLGELRALPGVESAAYASFLPMAMGGGIWPVTLHGEAEVRTADNSASLRFVTPGFFTTLRIPLLAGRDVEEADRIDRPFVAVVSRSLVERYWPNENPLGKRFRFGLNEREVVGVVADVKVRGLERQSEPQVYLPYGQQRPGQQGFYVPKDLVVRTPRPAVSLLPAITRIVRAADPAQPVSDVQTLGSIVAQQTGARAAQLRILATLAALALLLAAVGIHGLLSFAVARRAPEIGIRLALGERPSRIVRRVVSEGLLLLAVALAMTLLGSLLPALRAIRTDPLAVMRSD
jgi:predicted permease